MSTPAHIPETVLQLLADSGIDHHVVSHPPLMTVEDSKRLRGDIDATHVKNLFLRDKKRNYFLVTTREDAFIDLKELRNSLGASGSLGFASEERLWEVLAIRPGAVSPLALLNDRDNAVRFFLDQELSHAAMIAVHPLINELTVVMPTSDLLRLIAAEGNPATLIALEGAPDQAGPVAT